MYSHAIQDVDEFVSSWEQSWRKLSLHNLLTNGSSAVNGCRQNESFAETAQNNIQLIHTTPVQKQRNQSIKMFLTSKCYFLLKTQVLYP